jgi:hypothetical protein
VPVEAPNTSGELTTREQNIAELVRLSNELSELLQEAVGVKGPKFAEILLRQGQVMNRAWVEPGDAWQTALEMIISLQPKGSVQAMLAVQMLGIHSAATAALAQSAAADTCVEEAEAKINRATKLMRLFAQQAELMARLQGKITTQKVVVERVDIAPGSQAVVGVIEAAKERG